MIYRIFLFTTLFLLTAACNRSADEQPEPNPTGSFAEVLDSAGTLPVPVNSSEVTPGDMYTEDRDGEAWECTTETHKIEQGTGGSSGFPLFSPNASVVYPGNLLQGKSLNQATPDVIVVERAGGTFSTDVLDGSIAPSFSVDQVTKGNVTTALNNIVNASTGVVPANFNFSYHNVQSREEFALRLGVDVETKFTEVEADLSFSSEQDYNRYVIQLTQSFYTMSYDLPTSLDKIFAPEVTPEDLARYVGPGNPATYISDVTYGRVFYMLIESTSNVTEMQAAIAGSFNGVATQVDAEVEVDYLSELDELKIQVMAYGGASGSTLQTIWKTNLNALVTLLAEGSDIRAGKPISYVVRSVYDNQIVATQLATQYDVTNCRPVAIGTIPYTAHWTGQVVAQMGPVGAAYAESGTTFVLISQDGQQFMRSNVGELDGPFPIDQLGSEPCTLSGGIGAACNIEGNESGEFYLLAFNAAGTHYAYMNGSGFWGEERPLADLNAHPNFPYPYHATGVGALTFNHRYPDGTLSRHFFDTVGDKFCNYKNSHHVGNGNYTSAFLSAAPFANFRRGTNQPKPFPAVGAGIGFSLADQKFEIFFNKAGTKYTLFADFDGSGVWTFSPAFDL